MFLLVLVALLWLQLQFGALRVIQRVEGLGGDAALAVVWAASAIGLWALLTGRLRLPWRALRTPWPSIVVVALVALCALVVYPEVDGRRATGGGSDADDAVLLVSDRFVAGDDPYAEDTYLGNPPTTGPGSVLWALPFPGRDPLAFGVVLALGLLLVLLRRWTGGWEVPSLTALLLAASVPFWEGVAQGSDHLVMACGVAIVANGLPQTDRSVGLWQSICAGILATWRAAYLHLPVLLAIALWRRNRRAAVVIGAGGLAIALGLHAVLLSRTDGWDAYDPVRQLFVKSDEDLNDAGRVALVAGIIGSGIVVLLEARRRPWPRPEVLVLAGIGGPMAAIAIAGAFVADSPAAWSEASYLLPTLVLAAVVAARAVVESRAR